MNEDELREALGAGYRKGDVADQSGSRKSVGRVATVVGCISHLH